MKEFPVIDMEATGARIRELRKKNRLKVDEVREFLGLDSQQAIYKWQRGECMPTIDNLYALSVLFETSVDDIIRGSREEDELSSSFDFTVMEKIKDLVFTRSSDCRQSSTEKHRFSVLLCLQSANPNTVMCSDFVHLEQLLFICLIE